MPFIDISSVNNNYQANTRKIEHGLPMQGI